MRQRYFRATVKGGWNDTEEYLRTIEKFEPRKVLEKYGRKGVNALRSATPKKTGKTAASWDYRVSVRNKAGYARIEFFNTNIVNGYPIAVILNYGHGTRNGGYVVGRDYIDPAIRPIFDEIAEDLWNEVKRK